MKVKEQNVPVLRFPGFEGEWGKNKLENIADLIGGYAFPSLRMTRIKSCFQVIKMSNLYGGILDLERNASYLETINSSEEKFRIRDKDILLSLTGTVGKRDFGYTVLIVQPHNLYLNQRVGLLRVNQESNATFLSSLTKTDKFQKKFHALAIGGTGNQANVSLVDCRKLFFRFPSLPEQQKIASFLTAVDSKIEQLSKKKALLEQYKKGMMQKLFSQELRFKDEQGNEFPDWEEKRLGEICEVKRGASPRPISSPKWFDNDSEIGWVRISDVTKSTKYLKKTTQYLSNEGIKKSRLVTKGNMIMSICATIGKPIYTDFDVCIHDGFVVFDGLTAKKEYLFYHLEFIQKRWYRYGQPGTQVNLNSKIVSNEIMPLPCSEEQRKIASFLSSIDKKINLISTELNHAQSFKKSLLQQMFI